MRASPPSPKELAEQRCACVRRTALQVAAAGAKRIGRDELSQIGSLFPVSVT